MPCHGPHLLRLIFPTFYSVLLKTGLESNLITPAAWVTVLRLPAAGIISACNE